MRFSLCGQYLVALCGYSQYSFSKTSMKETVSDRYFWFMSVRGIALAYTLRHHRFQFPSQIDDNY